MTTTASDSEAEMALLPTETSSKDTSTTSSDNVYDTDLSSTSLLVNEEYESEKEDTKDSPFTAPRVPACRILLINLPWFGLALMYLILTVEVVPAQVEAMVGTKIKGTVLGLMVALGAMLTLVVGPLLGILSDRLRTRIGKRRPVMLVSSIILCASLMGMALSTSDVTFSSNSTETECHPNLTARRCKPYTKYPSTFNLNGPHVKIDGVKEVSQTGSVGFPLFEFISSGNITGYMGVYVGCYLFTVIAYTGIAVPYNALIADKTHPTQRGINSGVMGGMILLGNIGGACLGLFIAALGLYVVSGIICGIVLLCMSITLLSVTEVDVPHIYDPMSCGRYIRAFFEPFQDSNFRWLFFTRFMMQQGVSTVFTFIQYWVSDMVDVPNCWMKEKAVAVLMIPLVVAAAVCSILFGLLSDRVRRRKPLVLIAAILMSVSAGCFTVIRGGYLSYYITLGLIFLSGIGYGTYLSVDFALLLDILPSENDKAKDIAVWNQALILPQVLATPTGGFILDFFEQFNCSLGLGYIILFGLTSLYFFVSGVFVVMIDVP